MPLANKWGDYLASTEKGFTRQLGATAPLFQVCLGFPSPFCSQMLLTGPNAASSRDHATAATRFTDRGEQTLKKTCNEHLNT